ncbi:MAG: hypothetical protein ACLTR6_06485 [Clostridium fessum]
MSCFTAMRSITGGCFIIPQSARWLRFILPAAMRQVLDECAEMAARRLRESAECIGPVPAPVYKVNDIYRKILYIKCEKCAILDQIRGQIETLAAADTKWQAVQIQYDIS